MIFKIYCKKCDKQTENFKTINYMNIEYIKCEECNTYYGVWKSTLEDLTKKESKEILIIDTLGE